MRILHTADWHLGARLVDNDRLPEQAAFLDWLLGRLDTLRPDLLLLAGDVFDTTTPPQQALALYYGFLARLTQSPARCRVLVLGGNHDSPATLAAPAGLLRALEVRVLGEAPADPAEALLEFPEALVCAVPYLRERDVRKAQPGQGYEEIAAGIREGVRAHYASLLQAARARASGRLLIGTGHLTVLGSRAGDTERIIHIGTLGSVGPECFSEFAYVALGHIHGPQAVDAAGLVRYSGSPLALSFSEAGVAKELRVIDIADGRLSHRPEPVPEFRRLARLSCPLASLDRVLEAAQAADAAALEPWLELTVDDGREHPDLERRVREAARGRRLRILKILVPPAPEGESLGDASSPALQDLQPVEVFHERLRAGGIDPEGEAWTRLTGSFLELLSSHLEKEAGP